MHDFIERNKMSEYHPDKWVVVKITSANNPILHRVFACWYGGYLGSDSWQMNSGIVKAYRTDNIYAFDGHSGSTYYCSAHLYGTNGYGGSVLQNMIEMAKKNNATIEILPEETNWLELDYGV